MLHRVRFSSLCLPFLFAALLASACGGSPAGTDDPEPSASLGSEGLGAPLPTGEVALQKAILVSEGLPRNDVRP